MLISNILKMPFRFGWTPYRTYKTYKTNFVHLRKIYESDKVSDSFTKKSVLHANFMYNDDDKAIQKSSKYKNTHKLQKKLKKN
jgi:hypothetical protein